MPIYANPIGAMMQGYKSGQGVQDMRRENALRQLYEQQGAGIAAGDQNALNALAQLDPMAALDVRRVHNADRRADRADQRADAALNISQERLAMAKEQARQEAERLVAAGKAAEVEREAAQVKNVLDNMSMALGRGDMQTFTTIRDSLPEDYQGVTPENFPAVAAAAGASLEGMYEAMEGQRESPKDRYRVVGNTLFDLSAEGGPKEVAQGQGQTETIYDGEGNIIVQRGSGQAPPKLTVDAGKNTGFYIRTKDAHDTLTSLEGQGTNFWQQAAGSAPLGLGNFARTPEFQKFDQARRDFVNAILRRESGAVISEAEFENANQQYFPVPGDSPEVIAQKRRNRENAIEGLRIGSGEGASYVDGQRGAQDQPPQNFEAFANDPAVKAAAERAGVTPEEMWEIMQEGRNGRD